MATTGFDMEKHSMTSMTARIDCLPDAPQGDADLDLGRTGAYLAQDDGDPVLVLVDGDTTVRLEPGAADDVAVVAAAEQVADTALRFAELIRGEREAATPLRLVDAVKPVCMVPFDERAGCGVNIALVTGRTSSLVGLSFITHRRVCATHDLTLAQITQLRDELDVLLSIARTAAAAAGPTEVLTEPNGGQPGFVRCTDTA
ncbi:hypothetical protein [Dactylosporangium sp. NPDC051541]|uniref:hypothetical protein n=1 Tax=Dactylosporangium sp. NPDC051541 TaxID=3363977 RepID=UPI0037961DC9